MYAWLISAYSDDGMIRTRESDNQINLLQPPINYHPPSKNPTNTSVSFSELESRLEPPIDVPSDLDDDELDEVSERIARYYTKMKASLFVNGILKHGPERSWEVTSIIPTDDMDQSTDIRCTFDIDSFIINSTRVELNDTPLIYYPFPNRENTFKRDNQTKWVTRDEYVPTSTIPNICIGKTGPLSLVVIHIFFPEMRHQDDNSGHWVNYMESAKYEEFYDEIVKKALELWSPVESLVSNSN